MTRREEQAYNDGRLAFRAGKGFGQYTRRSLPQRDAWRQGYEHERRLDLADKITPAQEQEALRTVARLKAWVAAQRAAQS